MAKKWPFDQVRLHAVKPITWQQGPPQFVNNMEAILAAGIRLQTISPEEAARVHVIENEDMRNDAVQSIAHRNIQAMVIEDILSRAVRLHTITPDNAERIRALSDHVERFAAAQSVAYENVLAMERLYGTIPPA